MLKIHFINVGEGDSTLLEWTANGETRYALIDVGLSDVGCAEGDPRITATAFLKDKGITELEFLAITHLHRDHAEALGDVIAQARPKRFFTSFVPSDTSLRAPEEPEAALTKVKKLAVDLSSYCVFIQKMYDMGTEVTEIQTSGLLYEDDAVYIDVLSPAKGRLKLQNLIFESILLGETLPGSIKAHIAGMRNNNSLRLRVHYAGRLFGCDGDYYAEDAEREQLDRCDILKVAHHGDKKSLNETVVDKLTPAYAIISWSARYKPDKDRPSSNVTRWLRNAGAEVYFTGPFAEPGHPAEYHDEILFTIRDDGSIIPPERAYRA